MFIVSEIYKLDIPDGEITHAFKGSGFKPYSRVHRGNRDFPVDRLGDVYICGTWEECLLALEWKIWGTDGDEQIKQIEPPKPIPAIVECSKLPLVIVKPKKKSYFNIF